MQSYRWSASLYFYDTGYNPIKRRKIDGWSGRKERKRATLWSSKFKNAMGIPIEISTASASRSFQAIASANLILLK